jgi:hypothetical protein
MAISKVRVQINGTWTNLTYNSSTGAYEATITAPSTTSYNRSGGYYPVTVEATNTVGTATTVNDSHSSLGASCKLVVREKTAPVITISSPTSGARVTNNKQPVVFTVTDESGGSGVNVNLVKVYQDNGLVMNAVPYTEITNGYRFTYTPASALSDGSHTVEVEAYDNDGNAATTKSTTYTIDTVAPTLNITAPTEGMATASTSVTVSGTTNDATSSPVTLTMALDSGTAQSVTVATNGSFTKTFTGLSHGSHKVVIVATDAAGKATTITRNFTVDTSTPVISKITITPNPADAGSTMKISVVVTG